MFGFFRKKENNNDYLNEDIKYNILENPIESSLIGLAIGDAFGVPVEFKPRSYFLSNKVTTLLEFGTHNQPKGTWSDDTSMTIATMCSIIDNKDIDYNDIMKRFLNYYKKGEYTPFDKCFDIGFTCSTALYRFNGTNALKCGSTRINDNGNGSLMRMLPIVFYAYYKKLDEEQIYKLVNDASSITHGHDVSKLGCYLYTKYMLFLLEGHNKFESYELLKKLELNYDAKAINAYNRILKEDIYKLDIDEINSSGYVVDTLESVLWSVLNTNNYKDSIITSVNLGEDTDTIGAITGSISGLLYGLDYIPVEWKIYLKKSIYLMDIAKKFEKVLKSNFC